MDIGKSQRSSSVTGKVAILSRLYLISTLIIILTGTVGCATVTKGPVMLRVSEDRAALMWETEVAGPGRVLYGKDNLLNEKVTTEPIQVEYGSNKKVAFIHQLR